MTVCMYRDIHTTTLHYISGDFIRSLTLTRAWQKRYQATLLLSEIHFLGTGFSGMSAMSRHTMLSGNKHYDEVRVPSTVGNVFHDENEVCKIILRLTFPDIRETIVVFGLSIKTGRNNGGI